jgi:hypothetical protein
MPSFRGIADAIVDESIFQRFKVVAAAVHPFYYYNDR